VAQISIVNKCGCPILRAVCEGWDQQESGRSSLSIPATWVPHPSPPLRRVGVNSSRCLRASFATNTRVNFTF